MTDFSLWETAPLNHTIDHILSRYHETHRSQLAGLLPLAEKVASVHGDEAAVQLLALLQEAAADLESHMQKEERMLFPMIKAGHGRNAGMPVRVMMHEHDEHQQTLDGLRRLTDNFTPAADACNSRRRLYALTEEFAADLADHIELEDNILFPRALNS